MITSRQNPLVKKIKSLTDKKNRDQLGLFVVEGVKNVAEAIKSGFIVEQVVGTEEGLEKLDVNGVAVETVSQSVFDAISSDVSPQGVLALVVKPVVKNVAPTDSCLFLDGVSDPANVGAIIRTAAASGYKEVYIANGADAFNSKAVRVSMGGIFRVKVISGDREELAKVIPYPIIVADMDGENAFDFKPNGKFCLAIGNEANGVSEFINSKRAKTVSIPMDNGMESLNAAVSAGILMYQLKKR